MMVGDSRMGKHMRAFRLMRLLAVCSVVVSVEATVGEVIRRMRRFLTMVLSLAACAAFAVPPWEDPAVNAENRLEARAWVSPGEAFVRSLSGEWEFAWEGSSNGNVATNEPSKIATPFRIDVPSCVELKGWGVPHYTNIRYPFPKTPPKIDPTYNPTMLYRRRFDVPDSWTGRRIVLRFEGVASCAEIWINGKRVGYFEDARLPSEFDITPYLSSTTFQLLEVRVRKWCDGSYLEDQDMIRLAGIFRDVKLVAEPTDGVRDVVVTTRPDGDWRMWTVRIEGGDRPVEFKVENPRLWSPEDPFLYETNVVRNGDVRRIRYGVRDCRVKGGLLLFNGKPIKWKGVNRHETSPETGYALSYAEMVEDVKMMKRANFNCLRMSHYPNDPRMYDLCDEYGLLVCAEANVESHGYGYVDGGLANEEAWVRAHVERNVRNVKFYRNHPSVVMWSLGNEAGAGKAFERTYAEIRKLDPFTPIHCLGLRKRGGGKPGECYPCDPDFAASDVTSEMYISLDALKAFAGHAKPHWLCEYECAMGNGMGNLKEYWDVFYSSDRLSGGCIWDWVDQAYWKSDGRGGRYLAYGGDADESPNDGPFCANGLVDALRRPSAKLNEAKRVQQPLVVIADDAATGEAELWNRYEFTFADEKVEGVWELVADGVVVDGGMLAVPHLAPRAKGRIPLPKPSVRVDPSREHFYNVSFRLKRDEKWAWRGFEQARCQLPYGRRQLSKRPSEVDKGTPVDSAFVESADAITVTSKAVVAVFSRAEGTLETLDMNGKRILGRGADGCPGPRLQVGRAFTDSDGWMRNRFIAAGLSQLSHHVRSVRVEKGNRVVCEVRVTGAKSGGFDFRQDYCFQADGSILVKNRMEPFGDIPDLPRVGTFQQLDGSLENVRWYGRGPWENAVDRRTGCDVGLYASTVSEQSVDYIRPQDNGGKTDVRWMELTDPADGRGVRFSADGSAFCFQALHFTAEDLDQSRHRPGESRRASRLVPRPEVCLSIDCRQTGLGCNNCGPIPLAPYRFKVETTEWTVRLSAVGVR